MKRFLEESGDPTALDSYIERANEWYEDHAQEVGADVADLVTPVPFQSSEVLNYFVAWKFGEANQSLNVNRFAANDIYFQMDQKAFDRWRNLKGKLTMEYITGTVESRSDRAVSFGRISRSS